MSPDRHDETRTTPPPFSWKPAYAGVDLASASLYTPLDPKASGPREQNVNVARIDLRTPGLELFTTPPEGPYQTIGQRCTDFLDGHPEVMLAINANFSWPGGASVGDPFSLLGLAVSRGRVVCNPAEPAPQPDPPPAPLPDVPDDTWAGAVALLVTRDNRARIQTVTAACSCDLSDVWTAIAGGRNPGPGWPPQSYGPGPQQVLVRGRNMAVPQEDPIEGVAARTGVGLSEDGSTLYLLTIDGIEGQPYGADFYDLGAWLSHAGAYDGFALDGGGSTTMARRDASGRAVLVNDPHGDETSEIVQRVVGNFFGVITSTLASARR
jgi:hypothetical protein